MEYFYSCNFSFQNQVIANQLKRQNDELVKLRENLEAKNISELKLQVSLKLRFKA